MQFFFLILVLIFGLICRHIIVYNYIYGIIYMKPSHGAFSYHLQLPIIIFSIFVHFYPNDDNLSQNVLVMVLIWFIFCGVLFNTTTHHLTRSIPNFVKMFFPF
jgi:hypothetical protein